MASKLAVESKKAPEVSFPRRTRVSWPW